MTAHPRASVLKSAENRISAQMQADYTFRKQYCRTKIWIALPDGQTKTHYASDCSATVSQMVAKRVNEVSLSYSKGLEDCRKKEAYFRKKEGGYRTCIIYHRTPAGWVEVCKYIGGKLVEESTAKPAQDLEHFKVFIIHDRVDLTPFNPIRPCK